MDFIRAKNTYRENAIVQKSMAKKLILETISKAGCNFCNIFEIGSGTGLLTDEIVANFNFKRLFLNDLTDNFTNHKCKQYFKGDISKLNFGDDFCVDLIVSNAVFQWINNKETLFSRLFSILANDGILAFTYFGCKNFCQIKNISGFGLDYEDIMPIIKKTGFNILYFEEELETLYFKDVQKILEHIKLTGVGTNSNHLWTKSKYEAFKEKYLEKFSDKNGVELTYHPQYFILGK